MARRTKALSALSALVLSSCQWVAGYQDFSSEQARPPHPCDGLAERKTDDSGVMVRVDVPGGLCSWIDEDELSVAEYQRWRDDPAAAHPSWDPDFCGWKQAASDPAQTPDDPCARQANAEELQPFAANKPIRCVDWCDAEAYCRWAGKHLCYDNSLHGTQVPRNMPREWSYACDNGETSVYPWGDEARGNLCNAAQPVDALTQAERGVVAVDLSADCLSERGARDLIGNVAEWTYGCNVPSASQGPAAPGCLSKGGSYADALRPCLSEATLPNDTRTTGLGLRCCSDLSPAEALLISR